MLGQAGRVVLGVPLAVLVVVVVGGVHLRVDAGDARVRLHEVPVRVPQLAEDGLRRGLEVDAAEELRRQLLHRPPDERP